MNPAARPTIDRLEARRLLAAVEGTIWNDVDTDGIFDFFEERLPNVPVFLDDNANGLLDDGEAATVTDAQGNYRFEGLDVDDEFDAVSGEGGRLVRVTTGPAVVDGEDGEAVESLPRLAQTSPGLAGRLISRGAAGGYNIVVNFVTPPPPDLRVIVETAAARWEQVIVGDLPDFEGVDDFVLNATLGPIDGPSMVLANASFDELRPATQGGLPYLGSTRFDTADSAPDRQFADTVLHEIGHALGFGTLFYPQQTDNPVATGLGTTTPRFIGENAIEERNRLYGLNESSVPLQGLLFGEFQPGSSFSHWDEETFNEELMTPLSAGGAGVRPDADPIGPLSRMTIGAIEDLGYEVSYASADPFGPLGIGPLPTDFVSRVTRTPFTTTILLENDDFVADTANFGVRFNSDPRPFFFNAGPAFAAEGDSIRLLAEIDTLGDPAFDADPIFDGDLDFRDDVRQVNFFRESNGVEGLQTPVDVRRGLADSADTLLAQDAIPGDGFEATVDLDGDEGEVARFYALAYDSGYFTTVRTDTVTLVADQDDPPARPVDLRAVGVDTNTFLIEFDDRADDESGYLLQVAESPDFQVPGETQNVFITFDDDVLDADDDGEDLDPDGDGFDEVLDLGQREGTGPVRFTYTLPTVETGENTTRYFRLRAFNTAGSTPFAGPAVARTLSPGAVLIDNSDDDLVDAGGFAERRGAESAVGLTYLAGDGAATFAVGGEEFEAGRFFVFAQTAADANYGQTTVRLFDGETLVAERVVDEDEAGAEVLLGEYRVDGDFSVQFASTGTGGVATADAVRLLPAGATA